MHTYRGIHIYLKDNRTHTVLRDLMQIHKTQHTNNSFAFIASSSLLPNLTLWENLQMVAGGQNWQEILNAANSEEQALMRLIKNPGILTTRAQAWERFIISLLKGMKSKGNLLIDINENELSPLMVQLFKRVFVRIKRDIIIASESSSLWLDCTSRIYSKKDYKYFIEELDVEMVEKHWIA